MMVNDGFSVMCAIPGPTFAVCLMQSISGFVNLLDLVANEK